MYGPEVSVADELLIEELVEKHPVLRRIIEDQHNDIWHAGYNQGLVDANTRENTSGERPAS